MSETEDRFKSIQARLRSLQRFTVVIAIGLVITIALATVAIVRVYNQSASQSQLGGLQSDSCAVFEFVHDRFLVPTKTETAAQKKITAEFAGKLAKSDSDCKAAGLK